MTGSASFVIAVITYDNLSGLEQVVAALREPTRAMSAELLIVHAGASPVTTQWLSESASGATVLLDEDHHGPASSRNAVLRMRPDAEVYVFFDDDVFLQGHEPEALHRLLQQDPGVGIVSGLPTRSDGRPMTRSFLRRPWADRFPRLWDSWWGTTEREASVGLIEADVVGGAAVGVRREVARGLGGFETRFWPACFEDLDFCARTRFAGYRILVDVGLPIRQGVSATMDKVFADRYPILCRSSGVLFAALDYPFPFALGRILRAIISIVAGPPAARSADAHGLLRAAREWRLVITGRAVRRRMRRARRSLL